MPALGLKPHTFPRGQHPDGLVQMRQARFLAAYAETGMVTRAARWAKCTRWSHIEWLRRDSSYPQRLEDAKTQFAQKIEDTMSLGAVHGVPRPILHKGKQVYTNGEPLIETERSVPALIKMAEAFMP